MRKYSFVWSMVLAIILYGTSVAKAAEEPTSNPTPTQQETQTTTQPKEDTTSTNEAQEPKNETTKQEDAAPAKDTPQPIPASTPVQQVLPSMQPKQQDEPVKRFAADSTNHRIIMAPTGYGVAEGEMLLTGYIALIWNFNYGINDHIQLGVWTNVPIGLMSVAPAIKLHTEITDNFAVAAEAVVGALFIYAAWIEHESTPLPFFYSFNLSFSAATSDKKHIFNLNTRILSGGALNGDGDEMFWGEGALIMYSAGYRARISKSWSLQAEANMFTVAHSNGYEIFDGVLIIYGVRGHGEWMFGDIGFLFPAYEGFLDRDVWKYLPLGFPYFSIGFKF